MQTPIRSHELYRLFRFIVFLAAFGGCASSTVINTELQGAQVYVDNVLVGTTPYTYSDRKTIGSTTKILLKKEGYEDFNTLLVRNEEFDAGACAGGVFTLVPFLWVQKYSPSRTFELTSLSGEDEVIEDSPSLPPLPKKDAKSAAKKAKNAASKKK
jgi:hypothetical protein